VGTPRDQRRWIPKDTSAEVIPNMRSACQTPPRDVVKQYRCVLVTCQRNPSSTTSIGKIKKVYLQLPIQAIRVQHITTLRRSALLNPSLSILKKRNGYYARVPQLLHLPSQKAPLLLHPHPPHGLSPPAFPPHLHHQHPRKVPALPVTGMCPQHV